MTLKTAVLAPMPRARVRTATRAKTGFCRILRRARRVSSQKRADTKRAAAPAASSTEKVDRATAYYHYSLAHMYAELAATYNNRGDYFTKAIENYRLALKADPSASYVSEELSDLYLQSGRL